MLLHIMVHHEQYELRYSKDSSLFLFLSFFLLDGRRNFIAMVHGRKRYVLLPPEACSSLSLFPQGHPSARHSSIDWSNMTEIMKDAKFLAAPATEAVIARGDVLYIPSYW